jgi:penicillin amidase
MDGLPMTLHASNNWVIGGARTVSGRPLLANDPHLGYQVPSLWFLAHLEAPTLEVIGTTLPGSPGVILGRNRRVAWGATNVGADVQDLYVVDPQAPLRTRRETIAVKGAPPVLLEVRESSYGPILSDVEPRAQGALLALRWVSLDADDRTGDTWFKLPRVRDWNDFKAAMQTYVAPSQNFIYADVDGHIGYLAPGRFPIRRPGDSGAAPVPGNGEHDWRGYLPPAAWSQAFDPPAGFIASANNRVDRRDPPLTVDWDDPFRAERIHQLIASRPRLSADDMARFQQDRVSLLFARFRPALERLPRLSGTAEAWRQRLLRWDGDEQPSSREATVFEAWYTELARLPEAEVKQAFWGEPRYLVRALEHGDHACGGDCTDRARRAFEKAVARADGRSWGLVHQAHFAHGIFTHTPLVHLSDRQVPAGGDGVTVNVGGYLFQDFSVWEGPSYRQVVDLADPESSRFVMPMGQSGGLFSSHFDDLLTLWQRGQYLPMRMDGVPVAHRLQLVPRGQ